MTSGWLPRAAFLALVVAICAGCAKPIAIPATVKLIPNKTENVGDLKITFTAVISDSRCPIDAVCVTAGEAVVHLRVRDSATSFYDLHTSGPLTSVQHGDIRITLTDLQPFPISTKVILASEYRATIDVTEP